MAQGGQDGTELGAHDPTFVQVQVLEVAEALSELGGGGQIDPSETPVLQLIGIQALGQVLLSLFLKAGS